MREPKAKPGVVNSGPCFSTLFRFVEFSNRNVWTIRIARNFNKAKSRGTFYSTQINNAVPLRSRFFN